MIRVIQGSILNFTESHAIHQTNCETTYAAGVAADLFKACPEADVYSSRPKRGHDHARFSSITVHKFSDRDQYLINLYGQLRPGRPSPGPDSAQARLKAFASGLDEITELPDLKSVAFPCGIGCGMARGNWVEYLRLLEAFADKVAKRGVPVTLYCVNQRPHLHSTSELTR